MPFTDAAKNAMLDAIDESAGGIGARYLSLHTAYSATGTNEVTGGSPAYARKAATWNAAATGAKALASNVVFDVPATTVAFIGIWDAVTVGNFLGMVPNGSAAAKLMVLDDASADTFKAAAHGFVADDRVVFWGAALPTGVTAGTIYWVISANNTANAFQVSASQGGAAVSITAAGYGSVQKAIVETFASQGTFTVQASGNTAIDLNAV